MSLPLINLCTIKSMMSPTSSSWVLQFSKEAVSFTAVLKKLGHFTALRFQESVNKIQKMQKRITAAGFYNFTMSETIHLGVLRKCKQKEKDSTTV